MFVETRPDWGAPFTIVSAPGDGHLAFTTVMRDASPLKKELGELSPGDTVIVSGPYGEFTLDEGEEKTGMIAGGIGITPFISILHDIEGRGLVADAVLLYSSRRRSDTPYREKLERLAAANPNIEVVFTMTDDPDYEGNKGRIDIEITVRGNSSCHCALAPPSSSTGSCKSFNASSGNRSPNSPGPAPAA